MCVRNHTARARLSSTLPPALISYLQKSQSSWRLQMLFSAHLDSLVIAVRKETFKRLHVVRTKQLLTLEHGIMLKGRSSATEEESVVELKISIRILCSGILMLTQLEGRHLRDMSAAARLTSSPLETSSEPCIIVQTTVLSPTSFCIKKFEPYTCVKACAWFALRFAAKRCMFGLLGIICMHASQFWWLLSRSTCL